MKKVLSIFLAAAMSASIACIPANATTAHVNAGDELSFSAATSANAFGGLLDWNGVVFGNAANIIDVEGSLAVGGNFDSTRGLSVNNGAYGANPASTEDVAFLVGSKVKIDGYGSVYGQTVVGVEEGNTYKLSNVTPSDSTNGQFTVADSNNYFTDANKAAYAVQASIAKLTANGELTSEGNTYTFAGNQDANVLVYNVDDAALNSYLFDFNIADGQTVIVNLTTTDNLDLRNGAVRINGSMEPDYLRSYNRNIIFNVVNATQMEMTSGELYGILLAPDTNLTGSNANVTGTAIVNNLTGLNGFELHVGYNNSFVPDVTAPASDDETPTEAPAEEPTDEPTQPLPTTVNIRIDAPRKMAVAFADGNVYYGGETKEVEIGREYPFQMCAVNWDNGTYDENGNGLRGTVVYRMVVLHQDDFNERAREAKQDTDRYIVKGIDIIDTEAKMIYVNGDAEDSHLETDVNTFFMAYRFHFQGEDYDKKTGIAGVINTPVESLSVNLPAGSTVTCNAYVSGDMVETANVFVTKNSGEGEYDNVELTSVNDYTWNH